MQVHTLYAILRNTVIVIACLGTFGAIMVAISMWLAQNSEEPGAH